MVWIRFGGLRFSGISSKLIHPVGFGGGVWSGGVGWARGGRGGGGGDGDIVLLSEDSDRDGLRYSRGLCRPTVTQLFNIAGNFKLVISLHIKACLRTRSGLKTLCCFVQLLQASAGIVSGPFHVLLNDFPIQHYITYAADKTLFKYSVKHNFNTVQILAPQISISTLLYRNLHLQYNERMNA